MSSLTLQQLTAIQAFHALDNAQLSTILPLLTPKPFVRGQTLITHGQENTSVYFLSSGRVRATMYSPSGREISYQDIEQGEMLGELAAIDQQPRSTHVISLSDGVLLSLSRNDFYHLLAQYPSFTQAVLLKMAGVIRFMCDRVYEFSALSVAERLHAELVRMIQQQRLDGHQPITIENMPTHEELACRIATHREAVTRELGHLEKKGILVKKRNQITVVDLDALLDLVKL